VTAWIGRNGVAGTKDYNAGFCLRFTLKGGHAATRWRSVVDSLPAWHDRLRNVNILRRDAFELLPRIEDAPRTAIYVDPPYFHKSKRYRYDFEAEDHQRLAAALQRFRQARVVVSYYEDPSLDQLYPGWTQRRIPITKAMANQGRRGSGASRAVEILLLNGPSVAEQARLFRDPMTCETPCSESEPARG